MQPFVDTVRAACLNRCRIRRTVCHTVVDWDNLQMEVREYPRNHTGNHNPQQRTLTDLTTMDRPRSWISICNG
jgi:hypothetical protein